MQHGEHQLPVARCSTLVVTIRLAGHSRVPRQDAPCTGSGLGTGLEFLKLLHHREQRRRVVLSKTAVKLATQFVDHGVASSRSEG